MSLDSATYAVLADHSYDRDGGLADLADRQAVLDIGSRQFKVLAHTDNPANGYQGTIYQAMDSGRIIVAHRGTEFDREPFLDGLTDAGMVLNRHNVQSADAIELTRTALELARDPMVRGDHAQLEVTITGHSLGGTLAQVTAHHFGLRGETFNAYGAASLDRRIPEGGSLVVNHVMATDPVSAASPHFGEVRIYALPDEITRLRAGGYHDNRALDMITPDMAPLVAGSSFGAHSMHNFLDVDGEGRPDVSVLRDPAASRLAERHERTIENYRDDMNDLRRGITIGTRGVGGMIQDGADWIRGPLPAGEPAARESREGASITQAADRLDRLAAGHVDPAVREAWEADVATKRAQIDAPGQSHVQDRPSPQMAMA